MISRSIYQIVADFCDTNQKNIVRVAASDERILCFVDGHRVKIFVVLDQHQSEPVPPLYGMRWTLVQATREGKALFELR